MNILITGATSGIGKALLTKYQQQQNTIYACGRSEEKLSQISAQNVIPVKFDMTSAEEREKALKNISDIDLVILNAGDCEYIDDVMKFDGQLFERVINVNLISTGYMLEQLLPKMANNSRIVLVGSSVTLCPFTRAEAYGASKAGLSYLANSLRLDLIPHNIGVTLVEPGFVETPLTDKNDFNMPSKVSAEKAAITIIQGIKKQKELIRFPKRLMFSLRILSWLPSKLLHKVLSK